VLNLALYSYKALMYYYPAEYLGWELTTVFLYVAIEFTRLLLISRGNKLNQTSSLVYSILWGLPILVLHSFYIAIQTYV